MTISTRKVLPILTGTMALAAVGMEFYVRIMQGADMTVAQFFSYFTIQSNILVGLYCIFTLVRRPVFLNGSWFFGLALLNITLTGVVFFLLLRNVYHPGGIGYYANILLHYVVPILMLLVFISNRHRKAFRYIYILTWMLYPLFYLVYSMIRGSIIKAYPYPFLDLTSVPAIEVSLNSMVIAAGFGITALFFVLVDKKLLKTGPGDTP